MPNLLEQAINCNDGDRAAKIIQDALGIESDDVVRLLLAEDVARLIARSALASSASGYRPRPVSWSDDASRWQPAAFQPGRSPARESDNIGLAGSIDPAAPIARRHQMTSAVERPRSSGTSTIGVFLFWQRAAELLRRDEAQRIAANFAKLPQSVRRV